MPRTMQSKKFTRESFHVYQSKAKNALRSSEQCTSILLCAGTGCIAGGALKIKEELEKECKKRKVPVYIGLKHDTDEEKSLHLKMSGPAATASARWDRCCTSSRQASCIAT